jgi:hypothetical protein
MIEFANVDHYIYEGKNRERSPRENSRVFVEITTSPRAGRVLGLAAAAHSPTHRSRRGSCVRGRCRASLRSGRSRFRCRGGGLFRRTGAKNYPESRQGNSENQFFHDRELIIRRGFRCVKPTHQLALLPPLVTASRLWAGSLEIES